MALGGDESERKEKERLAMEGNRVRG